MPMKNAIFIFTETCRLQVVFKQVFVLGGIYLPSVPQQPFFSFHSVAGKTQYNLTSIGLMSFILRKA